MQQRLTSAGVTFYGGSGQRLADQIMRESFWSPHSIRLEEVLGDLAIAFSISSNSVRSNSPESPWLQDSDLISGPLISHGGPMGAIVLPEFYFTVIVPALKRDMAGIEQQAHDLSQGIADAFQ